MVEGRVEQPEPNLSPSLLGPVLRHQGMVGGLTNTRPPSRGTMLCQRGLAPPSISNPLLTPPHLFSRPLPLTSLQIPDESYIQTVLSVRLGPTNGGEWVDGWTGNGY